MIDALPDVRSESALVRLPERVAEAVRSAVLFPTLARAVEELLLNSLEAGARNIDVSVGVFGGSSDRCGSSAIEIRDNGTGINGDDFEALAAYGATSRSKVAGFKAAQPRSGGALAALRAVSHRLQIESKTGGRTWRKEFVDGEATECGISPCPRGPGTTIKLEGVLDALPVRRKLALGDPETEFFRVSQVVERVSLMYPATRIRLQAMGSLAKMHGLDLTPAATPAERMSQVLGDLGNCFLRKLPKPVRQSNSVVLLEGATSMPEDPQPSDRFMFIYINGRYVEGTPLHELLGSLFEKCSSIRLGKKPRGLGPTSVRDVAAGLCWPACVLNLVCDPTSYDIGFGPGAAAVEFRDWFQVLRSVRTKLLNFLKEHSASAAFLEQEDLPPLPTCGGKKHEGMPRLPAGEYLGQLTRLETTKLKAKSAKNNSGSNTGTNRNDWQSETCLVKSADMSEKISDQTGGSKRKFANDFKEETERARQSPLDPDSFGNNFNKDDLFKRETKLAKQRKDSKESPKKLFSEERRSRCADNRSTASSRKPDKDRRSRRVEAHAHATGSSRKTSEGRLSYRIRADFRKAGSSESAKERRPRHKQEHIDTAAETFIPRSTSPVDREKFPNTSGSKISVRRENITRTASGKTTASSRSRKDDRENYSTASVEKTVGETTTGSRSRKDERENSSHGMVRKTLGMPDLSGVKLGASAMKSGKINISGNSRRLLAKAEYSKNNGTNFLSGSLLTRRLGRTEDFPSTPGKPKLLQSRLFQGIPSTPAKICARQSRHVIKLNKSIISSSRSGCIKGSRSLFRRMLDLRSTSSKKYPEFQTGLAYGRQALQPKPAKLLRSRISNSRQ